MSKDEQVDESSQATKIEAEKQLRQVLNRVSEGNIDPMFNQLSEIMAKQMTKKSKQSKLEYSRAYAKNFLTLAISQ